MRTSETTWQWPIAVERYDFASPLTSEEQHALDGLLRLRSQPRRPVGYAEIARQRLPRLVDPICEALRRGDFAADQYGPVIYLFLKSTADTGIAYGQIPETDWRHILTAREYGTLPVSVARQSQFAFLVTIYLLRCFTNLHQLSKRPFTRMAHLVFGDTRFTQACETVVAALNKLGYGSSIGDNLSATLAQVLLVNQSPLLIDINGKLLQTMRDTTAKRSESRLLFRIAYGLFSLGILKTPLSARSVPEELPEITDEWAHWCQRWEATSTLTVASRHSIRCILLQVGVWLRREHPHITSPEQWDRQLCLEFVAAASALHQGEWSEKSSASQDRQPMLASSKRKKIDAARKFFRDLQEWGWISKHFNPKHSLTAPAYIHTQIGPNPRLIAGDVWAQLLQAALDLTEADIQPDPASHMPGPHYPLPLVQALALIWVFGGLRADEIRRLRVGCIRWDSFEDPGQTPPQPPAVVLLRVPANKTTGSFEKPISHFAAEAIRQWEQVRPESPPLLDPKTGEMVHFLFVYRGRGLGVHYLNKQLIPLLCAKAGVPLTDARGRITSHRARSTISSYLVTGEQAMTLLELKTWLGHSRISSTLHYVKPTLTRVAAAYTDTDYFKRNLRLVDVLVNQDAVREGADDNWLHYDLGHGYCTNDFFVKCAHRMACARCSFYLPKGSSQAQMLEAQANLRHMLQEIELTDEEVAAVEGDIAALETLLNHLAQVATPDLAAKDIQL